MSSQVSDRDLFWARIVITLAKAFLPWRPARSEPDTDQLIRESATFDKRGDVD